MSPYDWRGNRLNEYVNNNIYAVKAKYFRQRTYDNKNLYLALTTYSVIVDIFV